MTPAATTPAGRRATRARSAAAGGAPAAPGHRRNLRKPASPLPRRLSGPATGRAGVTVPAPRVARPKRAPARRRVSGGRRAPGATLGQRLVGFVRTLPDHPLLDRAIRGRAWIPILGVMLVGIVAMQVEVLKLGASMGRAIERGTALQSTNEMLRQSVASLADDQRIERLAAARGMVMPGPAGVGFLSAGAGRDVQRAIANIHPPSAPSFLALTTTNGAVATALTASTAISLAASAPASSSSTPASTSPAVAAPAGTTPGVTTAASSAGTTASSTGATTGSPGTLSSGATTVPGSVANLPSATGAAVATVPSSSGTSTIPAAPSGGASSSSGN